MCDYEILILQIIHTPHITLHRDNWRAIRRIQVPSSRVFLRFVFSASLCCLDWALWGNSGSARWPSCPGFIACNFKHYKPQYFYTLNIRVRVECRVWSYYYYVITFPTHDCFVWFYNCHDKCQVSIVQEGIDNRYRHLWATLWAVRSLQQRRLWRQGHLGWHPSWTWVVCTVLYCTVLYCTVLYWHPSWTRRVVCYVLRCDHRHLTSVTMQWCWLSSWLVISDSGPINIVTKADILVAGRGIFRGQYLAANVYFGIICTNSEATINVRSEAPVPLDAGINDVRCHVGGW